MITTQDKVICPTCKQSYLRRMHHAAASTMAFWMCPECDFVWIDIEDAKAGGRNGITLTALYGNHDWPLIEEGYIVASSKSEQ